MKISDDLVMFVPACGLGERVAARGVKPFLDIHEIKHDRHWMAMNKVIAMAPDEIEVEIALRREMGCPPLDREVTVHFMEPTTGQAQTIYNWLRRSRIHHYTLISNCDNVIDKESIEQGIQMLSTHRHMTGIVYTFHPRIRNDPRWSYVKRGVRGNITYIAEKEPISDEAVAGVYLLNVFNLRMSLSPEDIYLSQALARMQGLYGIPVKEYHGWNDLEQLQELEQGVAQAL